MTKDTRQGKMQGKMQEAAQKTSHKTSQETLQAATPQTSQEKICIHCYISGKVQGVWFRASTREQAQALNITGWARNLPDERVEVLACGEKEKIAELYEWLKHGPERAVVTNISYEELSWQEQQGFALF
jgi:acylphosphatase